MDAAATRRGGGVLAASGAIIRHPVGGATRTNHQQFLTLVAFMEKHGDLNKKSIDGVMQSLTRRRAMWARLSAALNAAGDPGAPDRSVTRWQKVWSDLKNNSRKKAIKLANSPAEGAATLTQCEYRVLKLMGMIKSSIVSAVPAPASVKQPVGARAPFCDESVPSPSPSPSPPHERSVFAPAFLTKRENPLSYSFVSEAEAEAEAKAAAAERSLEDAMFSWPQSDGAGDCVLEGTVMEDNSVQVHPAPAPPAPPRLRVAEVLGRCSRGREEEPPPPASPEPRPAARGHTVARVREAGRGWRAGGAAASLLARELARRRRQRTRDQRLQRGWQKICERGLRLVERFLDRMTSPASAPPPEDEEAEPEEVEVEEVEPSPRPRVLHPDQDQDDLILV